MRPRLAVITTVYRPLSHTDVIVSRWLEPRATDPQFDWPLKPRTEIASLYIAQFHESGRNIDIGRETAARYGVPIFETVRDALTLGGEKLAVDGVLLIGEHGDYPTNEWNQKMYPRRELFDAIVQVFRESGRSVPVFNDKHFSYDADSARTMVETAREMNFPLMAGSSVPVAGAMEPWTMPDGAALQQGLGLFFRGPDINGYHAIEWLQSLVAQRKGGESGIESVTAYTGDSFERALAEGIWSGELMETAIGQARKVPSQQYQDALQHLNRDKAPYPLPAAFCFRHLDGLQTTYVFFEVQPAEYTVAVLEEGGAIHGACSMLSGDWGGHFCPHFAVLCAKIEEFMLSGQAPYPIEHYLLCTLMTEAACHALAQSGETMPTPNLHLSYQLQGNQ